MENMPPIQLPFKRNSEKKLVSKSVAQLTSPSYNMSRVYHTTFTAEVLSGDNKKVELVTFIEKRPNLKLYKAQKKLVEDWRKDFGDQDVQRKIEIGEANEILFQQEIDSMQLLNKTGNPHIPRIVENSKNYLKMQFIHGISGEKIKQNNLNKETKLAIVKQTLHAAEDVFKDGIINMEYAPKNTIIIPNLKTGIPERVVLIDFGISFQVDREGKIEIDMDLFNKASVRKWPDGDGPGLFPPELVGKTGKVKIDAEKALVWSLTQRVLRGWLSSEAVPGIGPVAKQAIKGNPEDRQSLAELIDFFDRLEIDSSKIGSCISEEALEANKQMIGGPDSEVLVKEREMKRVLDELVKLNPDHKPRTILSNLLSKLSRHSNR